MTAKRIFKALVAMMASLLSFILVGGVMYVDVMYTDGLISLSVITLLLVAAMTFFFYIVIYD